MSVIFDEVEHSSLATEILETVHIGYLKRKVYHSFIAPKIERVISNTQTLDRRLCTLAN